MSMMTMVAKLVVVVLMMVIGSGGDVALDGGGMVNVKKSMGITELGSGRVCLRKWVWIWIAT